MLDVARQRSFSSHTCSKLKQSCHLPILRSGLKACNFTYGEIDFVDFCRVLSPSNVKQGDSFMDLGSGTGILLAAASMGGFGFKKVAGWKEYNKGLRIEFAFILIDAIL